MNSTFTFKRTYLIFSFTFMIYQGFIITFLNSLGYSESQIGFILSANMIAAVIGQFTNGYVSDKLLTLRQVMLIQVCVSIIAMSILFFSTAYIAFVFVAILMGFSIFSSFSTMDSWALFESEETNGQYAKILMFASIGKSLSTLLFGKLLEVLGYSYMPIFYVISASILLFNLFKMHNTKNHSEETLKLHDLKKLLNIKFFANVLLVSFIVFGMYTLFVNSNILIKTYGGTVFHVGIYLAVAGISELLYFSFINKYMNKMHPYVYLLVASILVLINVLVILFADHYIYIIASGFIYSGIFANFLMGAKKLFVLIVDDKVKNLGQSISSALYFSLAGAITTTVTGLIAENIGILSMFKYVLGIEVFVLVILIFLNLKLKLIKIIK